jgi:Domain of unknown function (DUF4381)
MPDTDPGSLDRLHDIAVPPPVPWWPPAPGWYIVGGMVFALLGLAAWCALARWRRDRYRREALVDLDRIARDPDAPPSISTVAELVKRVALAAYPRDRVASLTGDAWLAFLDATGGTDAFSRGAGHVLKDAAYRKDAPHEPSELLKLADVVRHWITHHRC